MTVVHPSPSAAPTEDGNLHRSLGTASLTAMTVTGVVGSGWLFAAYNAAKAAGPASLLSWFIAGLATLLVLLVFIDLAFRYPLSGGNVRWPQLASGPMIGAVIGWAVFLQAVYASPSEATAVVQYAAKWLPGLGLVEQDGLSVVGKIIAVALLAVFCFINLFAVRFIAKANNVVTVLKVAVPVLAVVLLLASGFDTPNYTVGGGFAPYGISAALSAVVGSGLIYAFTGLNTAAVLSGEAADPRRTVPRATLYSFGFVFVLYVGLQLAVLHSMPTGLLGSGWHGINMASPLAELASLVGLVWLSWLLLADAAFSPAATLMVMVNVKGRYSYGAAQNGVLPKFFAVVDRGSGVPRRALLLNFVVGSVVILAFGSWKAIASALSFYYGLSYVAASIAAAVLYATTPRGGWLGRWSQPVAFASFVLSGLILYWSTWERVRIAVPLLLIGFGIYCWRVWRRPTHVASGPGVGFDRRRGGSWLIVLLLALALVSWLGSFGGLHVLSAPLDSILIAAICAVSWRFGLRSGIAWRHSTEESDVSHTQDAKVVT